MKNKLVFRFCAFLLLLAFAFCGCDVENNSADNSNDDEIEELYNNTDALQTDGDTDKPTESAKSTEASEKSTQKPTQKATSKNTTALTGRVDDDHSDRKRVALTFDDGVSAINTKKLVAALDEYSFEATFFVIGEKIKLSPNAAKIAYTYALDCGMEIGIHSYTHGVPYDNTCSDEKYESEISRTKEALEAILPNYEVTLMRPVQGIITDARVAASPYSVIHWSIDTLDWKYTARNNEKQKEENIETIVNSVTSRVKDGDIILMHEIHDNSYEAALRIIRWLDENGYTSVTVSELLGEAKQSGHRYYNMYS